MMTSNMGRASEIMLIKICTRVGGRMARRHVAPHECSRKRTKRVASEASSGENADPRIRDNALASLACSEDPPLI